MADPLDTSIASLLKDRLDFHQAKVIAVDTTNKICTLRPGDSSSTDDNMPGIKYFAHVSPTVNTYAWYLKDGDDRIIIGVI